MSVSDAREEEQENGVLAAEDGESTNKATAGIAEMKDGDDRLPATDGESPVKSKEHQQTASIDAPTQQKENKSAEVGKDSQDAAEDNSKNSEMDAEVENLKKQVAKLKFELKETKSKLENYQNLSHKLEGLVGSLKSVILFLDPVKGKRVLQVEIARLERVLFPASATNAKGKKKKSKKKKKDKPDGDGKKLTSRANDAGEATKEERKTSETRKAVSMPPCEIGDDGEPIMMALEDTMEGGRPTTPPVSKKSLPSPLHYSPSKPKSHPRATDAAYWKEFSTQASAANEQAAQLERIMKQKQQSKSWGIGSLFTSP